MLTFAKVKEVLELLDTTSQQEYVKEKKKIEGIFGDLLPLFEETNAILAGGAITSLFTNKEINDLDIYFPNSQMFTKFMAGVLSCVFPHLTLVNYTNKSILFTDHHNVKMQVIIYKFFPEVKDIFDDFDFSVNMGAYDFKLGKFILHENFLKHNAQRYIDINVGTAYPLISVLRVDKYREKGYKVSKPQLLRLLLRLTELEINSWDEVIDHLGGMYGVDPKQLFDQTKEFSIEEVITQLDSVEVIDNAQFNNREYGKLAEELKGKVLSEEFASIIIERGEWGRVQYMVEIYNNDGIVKDEQQGEIKKVKSTGDCLTPGIAIPSLIGGSEL